MRQLERVNRSRNGWEAIPSFGAIAGRRRTLQQMSEGCLGSLAFALPLNHGRGHLRGRLFSLDAGFAAGVLQIFKTGLRSAQHPSHALYGQKCNCQRNQAEKEDVDRDPDDGQIAPEFN